MKLPPRREAALLAVESHWAETGWPPVVKDIAKRLGVTPPTAHGHLRKLRAAGLVEISPRGTGYRVTAKASEPVGMDPRRWTREHDREVWHYAVDFSHMLCGLTIGGAPCVSPIRPLREVCVACDTSLDEFPETPVRHRLELLRLQEWRDAVVRRADAAGRPEGEGLCDWFETLARRTPMFRFDFIIEAQEKKP